MRKIILNGSPEYIQIDVEVGVNQAVPHSDDVLPWDIRKPRARRLGTLVSGLANDFDCFDKPEYKQAILI